MRKFKTPDELVEWTKDRMDRVIANKLKERERLYSKGANCRQRFK